MIISLITLIGEALSFLIPLPIPASIYGIAIGTTRAMEMGEIEGAMSELSVVIAGVLTVPDAWLFSLLL